MEFYEVSLLLRALLSSYSSDVRISLTLIFQGVNVLIRPQIHHLYTQSNFHVYETRV